MSRKATTTLWGAVVTGALGAGACSADIPKIPASELLDTSHATTIVGRPDEIYQRIARQAQRCWFGPFGTLHGDYMMHAEVPSPTSSDPVAITVHRRLRDIKRPWGPTLLRLQLEGETTTTLQFANLGLKPEKRAFITEGMTRWANGRTDCGGPETSADDAVATSQSSTAVATGATPTGKKAGAKRNK